MALSRQHFVFLLLHSLLCSVIFSFSLPICFDFPTKRVPPPTVVETSFRSVQHLISNVLYVVCLPTKLTQSCLHILPILCFQSYWQVAINNSQRSYSKQNNVARIKSNILPPPQCFFPQKKFQAGCTPLRQAVFQFQ